MPEVLPAYAGMIPMAYLYDANRYSAPRVCGDDPCSLAMVWHLGRCSPRMRG